MKIIIWIVIIALFATDLIILMIKLFGTAWIPF